MWWIAVVIGCSGSDAEMVDQEEAVRDEMSEHWEQAEAARDAAIDGDLAVVKEQTAALAARLPVAGLPDEVLPIQEALGTAVGNAAAAEDLTTAALALGTMARTCGRCHDQLDAELGIADKPAPEATEGVKAEMARHKWAAERMWIGLIRPDDAAFTEAVTVLSESSLVPGGMPPMANELEKGVHELAEQAKAATDPTVRAEKYGQMLVTCATCHSVIRDPAKHQ